MTPPRMSYVPRSTYQLQRFSLTLILIGSLYMAPTIIDFISSHVVSVVSIPRIGPFGISWNLYASFGAVLCSCGVLSLFLNLIYAGKRTLIRMSYK